MKKTIKFLGLALFGIILINTGCEKAEESLGTTFTVTTSDGGSWSADNISAKMEGSSFVITASKDDKEVILTTKEFVEGSYHFNDSLNYATYTPNRTDETKLYSSAVSNDNYIKIVNIHSDGSRSDGKFSFLATDANNEVLTISGAWLNVSKN